MYKDQIDGNISISSNSTQNVSNNIESDNDYLDVTPETAQTIPVHIGLRPHQTRNARPLPVRKTVRRDNKVLQALSLPKFSLYNMRSLIPKIQSFSEDMIDGHCQLIPNKGVGKV